MKKNSGPPCSAYFCKTNNFCNIILTYRQHITNATSFAYRWLTNNELKSQSEKLEMTYLKKKEMKRTWTMPPGRPPRSSSLVSDLSQSAATICIKVPFALNWKQSKYIIILNWKLKFNAGKLKLELYKMKVSEFNGGYPWLLTSRSRSPYDIYKS